MIYFSCYLLVGLILILAASPVREMIDKEIQKVEISFLARAQEAPRMKLLLFRLIVSGLLILIYPIILYADLQTRWKERKGGKKTPEVEPVSRISWLGDKISIEEAEEKYTVIVDGQHVPFGSEHNNWKKLLQQKKQGDELFEFRSPDESWAALSGVAGVALTRKGKIIADIVTRMS